MCYNDGVRSLLVGEGEGEGEGEGLLTDLVQRHHHFPDLVKWCVCAEYSMSYVQVGSRG